MTTKEATAVIVSSILIIGAIFISHIYYSSTANSPSSIVSNPTISADIDQQESAPIQEPTLPAPPAPQVVTPKPALQKVYLTRNQIKDETDKGKEAIETYIASSQAQSEINEIPSLLQNLEIQESEIAAACSAYSGGCNQNLGQSQADMNRPQSTGNMEGEQQTYELSLEKQQIENQIATDTQAMSKDKTDIINYRNAQYESEIETCAKENDIAPTDVEYCQSLFGQ